MGNHHSASHNSFKPRKNVHWKSAGRPAPPGKPEIIPILSDDEPNAITLRWAPTVHDGGAPLRGYQVECNRLGSAEWIRTSPPIVLRPELVLSGLEPPHRYQFRVAAVNDVGRSNHSELSDVLNVGSDRSSYEPPVFLTHLEDVTALENEKTEFRVNFSGNPAPNIAWFKDDYEIFSSRRTAISITESSSVLLFHQTLPSDEGEIKCTATNRGGHAVTKARLSLEAAPKLRYPRQYEDGLLYEINETIYLKTTIVGKPTPSIEWRHDGQPIITDERVEISSNPKFSILKIHSAKRSDRGEYQVQAKNAIGEDTASFLVTVTAPPDPPRRVSVTRQVDKSVTLDWESPEDDGGCRVGNYVVEYYRTGWNVWLKATTSRKTNVTLFDLIEGSEYKFRVKAESPYGMSAPSVESAPVRIPGRAVDMEFLAAEARIINDALTTKDGEEPHISPAPRRKRAHLVAPNSQELRPNSPHDTSPKRKPRTMSATEPSGSNEFMLVLYPEAQKLADKKDTRSKRESFQLDQDSLSPPPISLSAPELSSRCLVPFKTLRNAVSTTQLLHERAMARFYKAVEMEEEQTKQKNIHMTQNDDTNIPQRGANGRKSEINEQKLQLIPDKNNEPRVKTPEIFIQSDSVENNEYKLNTRQLSCDSEISDGRWQQMSFEEDYTASTVSTDGEYSDEGSFSGEIDRTFYANEEETYNPRNKIAHPTFNSSKVEEEEDLVEEEVLKPLPDPNFVPKPILKRREMVDQQQESKATPLPQNNKLSPKEKPKKEHKLNLFKKITKMPSQKTFGFPKILNKNQTVKDQNNSEDNVKLKSQNRPDKFQDKISDEGRTVIDYYGNIVKEYGSSKKPTTPIYLNTEDLKLVAEQQELKDKKEITKRNLNISPQKVASNNVSDSKYLNKNKLTQPNHKNIKSKNFTDFNSNDSKVKNHRPQNVKPAMLTTQKNNTQQIILKKAERATIVIPINYQELETKAKRNVRSVIDYTVDLCLLVLAFWVYIFKDERLAIPFVVLIIYRQLQETLLRNIPEWYKLYTPNWLKKKTS